MPINPILFQHTMGLSLTYKPLREKNTQFTKPPWRNVFMPSKDLNDEVKYVFDRMNRPRLLGNELAKPTLIMNRDQTQQTSFANETD